MLNILGRHAILILFFIFLIFISVLAYKDLFPTVFEVIPYYDSVGHFLLFGTLGLIAHYSFDRKLVRVFGRDLPIGPTLVTAYAIIDESLQVLSSSRTFDLVDLFWGIFGIVVFIAVAKLAREWHSIKPRFVIEELFFFTIKELRAVIFPALFLIILFLSNYIPLGGFYRYDFLFVATLIIQIVLVASKLETKDEAKTVFLFHIVGLCLELYKTHPSVGSWSYPESGYLMIMGVPLYSGFMYAAVGSYIAHAWKVFSLRITDHPPYALSVLLCFFIYLNFFTNHFIPDFRILLFVAIFAIYFKTDVYFTPRKKEYKMPLTLSFILIAFFVWLAENIATFYGAWKYPGQIHAWEVVSLHKITSWFLLVIICFIIVAYLKHFKEIRKGVIKSN